MKISKTHHRTKKGIIKRNPVRNNAPKIEMISPYDIKNTYEKLEYYEGGDTIDVMVKHLKQGRKLPPILIDENNELIDGRHRQKAYIRAGITKVPIIRGLSPLANYTRNGKPLKLKIGSIQGQSYAYEIK
jgi:hypothetical protein